MPSWWMVGYSVENHAPDGSDLDVVTEFAKCSCQPACTLLLRSARANLLARCFCVGAGSRELEKAGLATTPCAHSSAVRNCVSLPRTCRIGKVLQNGRRLAWEIATLRQALYHSRSKLSNRSVEEVLQFLCFQFLSCSEEIAR